MARRIAARQTVPLLVDAARRAGFLETISGAFAIVPTSAIYDRALGKRSALHVLLALCRYRNSKTGKCCPSIATLARDLGVARSTVHRHLQSLVATGHVVVESRTKRRGRGQAPSQYWIV